MKIKNFVQLTKRIGTAGQPRDFQFADIRSNNYEAVVNLATSDHTESISNEGEIVTILGMTYIHLPVPFNSPRPSHVKEFCGYMDILKEKKVFIHCIMNYRVSAFMFHYQNKVLGLNIKESKSPMFKQWQPNKIWTEMLKWDTEKLQL